MSPTIVTKDGKPFSCIRLTGEALVLSQSPYKRHLILLSLVCPQEEAVNSPRIHHQWLPDEVYYEQRGLSKDTLEKLSAMGYKNGRTNAMGRG